MFFEKTGQETKKAWKASGGIAVLVKETLRTACKFEPVSDSDVVWVRVQKDIAKLNSDLYLAFVYLPPCNSTYGKAYGKEIVQKLEKHIEFFSCKGKVIICGDFNARVGDLIDGMIKKKNIIYLYLMMVIFNSSCPVFHVIRLQIDMVNG